MGTPTKVYSLIEILLSIIRVYLKRVFQVLKRELFNKLSLIHGMVGKVINHIQDFDLFVLFIFYFTQIYIPNIIHTLCHSSSKPLIY